MLKRNSDWSSRAKVLIQDLHSELSINNNNWHKLKTNKSRRAAELLSGALSQLIHDGKTSDIEALIKQSLLWIKDEIKDPGCPSH